MNLLKPPKNQKVTIARVYEVKGFYLAEVWFNDNFGGTIAIQEAAFHVVEILQSVKTSSTVEMNSNRLIDMDATRHFLNKEGGRKWLQKCERTSIS